MFSDRIEAGEKLAEALTDYRQDPAVIVLALPRGGVVVAAGVAERLGVPLEIMVVRKIGAPENPEYAIGAITECGETVFNEAEQTHLNNRWLKNEIKKEMAESDRRVKAYRHGTAMVNFENKTVIVVDDGLATGLTMKAAIQSVKKFKPGKVIVAVPVAAKDAVSEIKRMVDEVVVLQIPEFFGAVGQFYKSFPQVSDHEVAQSLKRASGLL